jgi:hypothetical protein
MLLKIQFKKEQAEVYNKLDAWAIITALHTSCVMWGKSLKLSEPHFLHPQNTDIHESCWKVE